MARELPGQSKKGEIIFSREAVTEEDGNNIWDDTALIKAYDNAVSEMKAKLLNESVVENGQDEKGSDDQKLYKKKQRKRNRGKKNKGKWKVGMSCRAVFSEDGLIYDATIISLDEEAGTCIVSYDDYGNEEEHNIADLKRHRKRKRQSQSGDGASEIESACDGESGKNFPSVRSKMPAPNQYREGSAMPPPPPPQMPPSFGNGHIPFIPPPPPPISDDPCDVDNEAMCSMLMAWYMSGYHTGYYQGLKEGRKQGTNRESPLRPDLR